MLKWVAKRLKHVWSNTDQTIDTDTPLSKRGTHACIKHVWYAAVQTNKTSPIKHENKRNNLSFRSNVWRPSNFTKYGETRFHTSNTIKLHQTRCPNGKMFVHQPMFNAVWSPNISHLSRSFQRRKRFILKMRINCIEIHDNDELPLSKFRKVPFPQVVIKLWSKTSLVTFVPPSFVSYLINNDRSVCFIDCLKKPMALSDHFSATGRTLSARLTSTTTVEIDSFRQVKEVYWYASTQYHK